MSVATEAPTSTEPRTRPEPGWVENRPSSGWFRGIDLNELWAYRELAFFFALRELKVRYKQTALGVAWAVLQPLVAMAIFSAVFGRLAGLPSDGLPYSVFVFSGLAVWLYFSTSVNAAADSLVEDRALVTKVYFPRVIAPVASVLPALLDMAIALVAVGVTMAVKGVSPGPQIVLLPLGVAAAVFVAGGAGLWLSALNVLYRDVRYVLAFAMQIWLYASPIVFPSSLIHGTWRWIYSINPMAGVIDFFRWILVDGPAPPRQDLVSVASALLIVLGGLAYFRRVESQFADQI